VVLVLLVGVLSAPLASMLHLGSIGPLLIVAAAGGAGVVFGTLRGVLQGRGRFGMLSLTLVGDPTLRLAALLALLGAGFVVGAVPGGFLIATVTTAAVTAWLISRPVVERDARAARRGVVLGRLVRSIAPYTVAVAASIALYNVGVLVARATLEEHAAGIYGAGAVLGRAVYFIGSSAGMALLPLVAGATSAPARMRYLLEALAFTAVLAGGLVGLYVVAPSLVVRLTYGAAFEVLAGELWIFGLAMLLYALAHLAMSYLVALGRWRVTVPLVVAALAQAVLLGSMHGSVHAIAVAQVAVMALANVLLWPLVAREVTTGAR
jgi:O-antigen/teichoic acid export membrane protein